MSASHYNNLDQGQDRSQQHQHQHASPPAQPLAGARDGPEDKTELATSDESSTPELERWNQPGVNRGRYLATVFGLAVMGMNDACVGALIPYVCVRCLVHCPLLTVHRPTQASKRASKQASKQKGI